MTRLESSISVALALLVTGCAATSQQSADQAAGQDAATSTAANLSGGEVSPNLVVDAADPNPESAIRCRDVLKQGSNVITTMCMSLAAWERFERRQTMEAQEILRRLQGSAYR